MAKVNVQAEERLPTPEVESEDESIEVKIHPDSKTHSQTNKSETPRKGKRRRRSDANSANSKDEDGQNSANGDIYEVAFIVGHKFTKKGKLQYKVRWKGYDESEDTFEPEVNLLPSAKKVVTKYHKSIGGTPTRTKKPTTKKSKATAKSTQRSQSPPPAKRAKNTATEPKTNADSDSENHDDSREYGDWLPKASNWNDLIAKIETVERDENGDLEAHIRFRNGKRTKVPKDLYYKHCPEQLLSFYESHL